MEYRILFKESNDAIRERYELAMERIASMQQEYNVQKHYIPYFHKLASFVMIVKEIVQKVEEDRLLGLSLEELQEINQAIYEDIFEEDYETSYMNPSYACRQFGDKFGKMFSFFAVELRTIIVYAYEYRLYELTIYLELLIEVYNFMEEEDEFTYKDVKRSIYDFMSDYCDVFMGSYVRELIDTKMSFAKDIIMEADFSDLRYLYRFGEYITENELESARFLNALPEDQIKAMAKTYTEGYRLGFIVNRLDLNEKQTVNIRYPLGFERMVYYAILNFKEMGLEPVIYRSNSAALNKRQHLKIGYHSTSPNRQYDYDHRYDIGFFLDKALKERKLECLRNSLEQWKEKACVYAGPAVIEVFGEELFAPEDKAESIRLDKRQQKLFVDYYNEDNLIKLNLMKLQETSFTIISYPIPEIGSDYKEIFAETVKVNTLNYELYQQIQQCIIDALDQGDYVRVLGAGDNRTDMLVKLYPLTNPDTESIFENCVSDVNIPVGEVFTTPVLKGTKGILHVRKIYLRDLEYRNLELVFEDGRIVSYRCTNFLDEAKNLAYLKENLFFNQESLPLGEFAIGTNTTAYMMARKFDIAAKLPILIAEKTGPHFAIGDTCYKMSEDIKVYNPDGKELIARDNEISLIRKTEPEKAYFNCHTDITLPYDEIKEISIYKKDGTILPLILDSRFVLEGTQELNKALD